MTENGLHGRLLTIVLACVIGVALMGYFVGTRPETVPSLAQMYDAPADTTGAVAAATPYRELRTRRHGVHAISSSNFAELRKELPASDAPVVRDLAVAAASVALRAGRRAFDGAPPVVPHRTSQRDSETCLVCHRDGAMVEGRLAPPVSHPEYQSCTQCHVSVEAPFGDPSVTAANRFVGLASPGSGSRAWTGAPPTIPHTLHMRETCIACHGAAGRPGLRTTHAERKNCRQCHAARDGRDELPWVAAWAEVWP